MGPEQKKPTSADIDSALNCIKCIVMVYLMSIAALNKLEKSQKGAKETKAKEPSGKLISGPPGEAKFETEVDKMLQEFAKMMPGAAGAQEINAQASTGGNRTSQEQIEQTFKKLLQEPIDPDFGADDVNLEELGDMQGIIEQMMAELTSKDILYDPFSEMIQKYPAWLEANEAAIDEQSLRNYRQQLKIATEVVGLFDREDYQERKSEYQAQIFTLMQSMQEYGTPPEGLLAEAAPEQEGDSLTDEEKAALPNCNQM